MPITRLETFRHSHACLVRVTDDAGAVGWGQTAPYNVDLTEEFLHRVVAPWVLGREGDDIDAIVNKALDRNYKFMGTFLYRAVAGADTALWDLKARRAGVSVGELLGGKRRAVPVYGSSMRRDNSPEAEVQRIVQAHHERGFRAFKIKIGPRLGNDDDPAGAEQRTRSLVPLVRRSLPDSVQLFADANGSYDTARAIDMGRFLADHGFTQYEEPCPHTDVHATARVTAALTGVITVTGGEQDYVPALWQLIINLKAVHIVQPDLLYNGGICRTLAVARLASDHGIAVLPHAANHAPQQVFTLHLMAALPHAAPFMEYSLEHTDWTHDLYTPAPLVHDGAIAFPSGPGWGFTPHPDWLARASHRISTAPANA